MDAKEVGSAIAYLRKEKGYTQSYLADRIGVSDKAVSKWERGLGTPDISLLTRLSIVLDIDIECLLEGNLTRYGQKWKGAILAQDWEMGLGRILYDKPLADYLLSYFLLVGITDILIFARPEGLRFLEERSGYYEGVGLHLRCEKADAFSGAQLETFAGDCALMTITRPGLVYGLDLTKYLQRAIGFKQAATSLVIRNGAHHKVQLPLLFLSDRYLQTKCGEVSDCADFVREIEKESAKTPVMIGRGMIFLPLSGDDEAAGCADFVRLIWHAQRLRIADLTEIAANRGI